MGVKADSAVSMAQFSGMFSNIDPVDLQPGQSEVQVNVMILRPGELTVRRGLRELTFDVDPQ